MSARELPDSFAPVVPVACWKIGTFSFICWLLLLLMVLGSALGIVVTTFKTRHCLSELDGLRRDARDMQVLWGQYLVEKSTWATYARVHEIAQSSLGMQTPEACKIVILQETP